jgi:hypothetical protein
MAKLNLPNDADAKFSRAIRNAKKPGIVGACLWCGHGYPEYSREIENEHFANVCPNAPEQLKADAKKRLGESAYPTWGKRTSRR